MNVGSKFSWATLAAMVAIVALPGSASANDAHVPVRVVVVTTFNTGDDDLSAPGEFNIWAVNEPMPVVIPFPQGYHHLRYNPDRQILEIETGEGPVHAAASIEALANDPRFDLSHAYWLLAGIAGIDANVGPVASASWADTVVDGDLAYEIDAREIPPSFSTGYVPLGRSAPYQRPVPPVSSTNGVNLFQLNAGLVRWAYQFSHGHVTLPDTKNLRQLRAGYAAYPATQAPPAILKGATLAAGTFWIGHRLNAWAEQWVSYWSQGHAVFTMSSEEDAGYLQALTFLAQVHQIDFDRVLDLRAASDFTVPRSGQTAAQLLAQDATTTGLSAFSESLNDEFLTGSAVVNELTDHWDRYGPQTPSAP